MLTYTYSLANGGDESICVRVRDVLGLGSQSFPLRNPNGTPVKLTRNGVTVTVSKVDGVYRMESKQDGVKYREIFSGGASGLMLLLSGDFVELTEDIRTLEWEFVSNGGFLHRFSLTRDDKKSKTSDVAIKMEDASGSGSAVEVAEAPKAAETAEAPKTAETPKHIRPHPDVVARGQARADEKEAFQAAGEAALPGSNWGNARPTSRTARFDPAAIEAKERADDFRRRREQMEAELSGGAPGGSFEQPTQAMDMTAVETQAVDMTADETQAVDMNARETQAVVIDDEVDQRYAVLTVTKAPSNVGVPLHRSYVLDGDFSIGRNADCDLVLIDPKATFSRVAVEVRDNGEAGVILKINGKNGVVVKSAGGITTTHDGIVQGDQPKEIRVFFGEEFSIPRGGAGNEGPANYVTFKVTKPM